MGEVSKSFLGVLFSFFFFPSRKAVDETGGLTSQVSAI